MVTGEFSDLIDSIPEQGLIDEKLAARLEGSFQQLAEDEQIQFVSELADQRLDRSR